MKISKELQWLEEYVVLGLPYLPKRKKISKVIQFKCVGGRYGSWSALCTTEDHKSYRLYLKKFSFPRYLDKPTACSKIDLLASLAHEMAHLIDMEHTPKHKKLESKLISLFMTRLAANGYVSEEEELSA